MFRVVSLYFFIPSKLLFISIVRTLPIIRVVYWRVLSFVHPFSLVNYTDGPIKDEQVDDIKPSNCLLEAQASDFVPVGSICLILNST